MRMQTIHEKELGKAEKLLFLQSEPLAGASCRSWRLN